MDGEPPFEEVCSLNTKARLLGIQRGMRRTDVDGFPAATILTRSLKTESATRKIFLESAGMYSPRIEESSGTTYFLCTIDIAGTERMFGPPEKLACRLSEHLRSLSLSAHVIISSNFHAAVCLAKGTVTHSITMVRHGEESAALSALALDVLPLSEQQAEIFALWGINTLGMLAALPDNELVARIGQDGRELQQLARGELPHLFKPIESPFRLDARQEFDFPVELLDSLMFGIAVMLDEIILKATIQLSALAAVTLILELDGGATHTCRVRPAQPGNDKRFWLRLLHLELQTHPPKAAVVAVTLQATSGNTSTIQLSLFSPPVPESARLDVTLAQLKGLLGDENVGYPILLDSYAPESFRVEPFSIPSPSSVPAIVARQRSSARLVRPSETIAVDLHHSRPKSLLFRENRFIVEHAYGPWTSGGEWWSESVWNIQQWDLIAATLNGSLLYCSIDHDLLHNRWQLTALYD
jgi:protein ImuB